MIVSKDELSVLLIFRYILCNITLIFEADMAKVRFKIWVEEGDEVLLGNGRVRLLEAIDEFGSISAAAKSMQMSYKKAWAQVDGMNSVSALPLVEKSTGGKNGGGAILTQHGKEMVQQFKEVKQACKEAVSSMEKKERFK